MFNSPIITAFRDALRRNEEVNKQEYIEQIHQSSLTKIQKALSIEELNLVAWEFGFESYSYQELIQMKRRLEMLSLEEESENSYPSAANTTSVRWSKIQAAQKVMQDTLSSFTSQSQANQKAAVKNGRDNLLAKVESLLKKHQEEESRGGRTVLDEFLVTLMPQQSVDTMLFMHNLILFRQSCKDKNGQEGGTEDCVKALMAGFELLSDEDLQRNYEQISSPELVSLTNAFFTQRYIQMYSDDIDATHPAYSDALSIWPMNKVWMKASIYDSITEKGKEEQRALSMQPEAYAERAFMSASAQFYTLLANVYDCLSSSMHKRRLKGYAPIFMEEQGQIQAHTLSLAFENGNLIYQTDLSGGKQTISPQDCLAAGFNKSITDQMFASIQEVFLFNPNVLKPEEVANALYQLRWRHLKKHMEEVINKYFLENKLLVEELRMLCQKDLKEKEWLNQLILKMYSAKPEAISSLVTSIKQALLEDRMNHYQENVILKITTQRGHTQPSKSAPFFSEWPIDSQGNPLKITISPEQKHLIGESVKANNPVSRERKTLKMEPDYRYRNKPEMFYFGKMIRSLGGFFNPNSFCDFLLTAEFSKLKTALQYCDPLQETDQKKLETLHKIFQSTDLRHLMTLIKMFKEGDLEQRKKIYQWLDIKNPNAFLEQRFQAVIEQLYDSADAVMQLVREKLHVKEEYGYYDLQWNRARMFNTKTSACMKRLLEVYADGSPGQDLSYTWSEQFSLFWNPGVKLKQIDEPLVELVKGTLSIDTTAPNTPFSTPKNSPKAYMAVM